MNPMEGEVLTVSELRDFINQTLSYAYPAVVVEGEISGFKINQDKWVFFDIKDKDTTVSCFMTKYQLHTALMDGMLVRVTATPNLTKWGRFSLTVKYVELAGEGAVKLAFDKLKAQFEAEGLFAAERKRSLPDYPTRVGLITSSEAAAYNDFVAISADRWPLMEIEHLHVHVQGVKAPGDVVGAIEYFNKSMPDLEAIIIIRGGGSAEDLQAFNHELVVRAVYASHIPTLVGIGHEDDVSLAELVADVRASTPTDAARRLTPDQAEVRRGILDMHHRQARSIERRIVACRTAARRLVDLIARVEVYAEQARRTAYERFSQAWTNRYREWTYRVESATKILHGADPARLLQRGYAIARLGDKVVTDPSEVPDGSEILIQLRHGWLNTRTTGGDQDAKDSQISIELS